MFATHLLDFFGRNEVITRHAHRIDLTANDLWDLDLKIDWIGFAQASNIHGAIPTPTPTLPLHHARAHEGKGRDVFHNVRTQLPLPLRGRVGVGGMETGQIEIRNATNQDTAALKEFLLKGLGDHSRFLFAPYPYAGDLDGAIQRMLSECQLKKTLLYHAWHKGGIIGHFFLGGIQEPVPGLGIAVADNYHGKKLGNLFMTILVAAGHFAGSRAIELTTNPQNLSGFHLYQKLGFVHVGDREITVADGSSRIEHELIYRISQDPQ